MAARRTRLPEIRGAPVPTADARLVARIAERGTLCRYPRNAIIQTEGEPGDTLCLVLAGRLKVFVGDDNGHEVFLETLVPGDCVGMAMMDGGRRAVSVKALTPVQACILSRVEVETLIADDPSFTKYLLLRLIKRGRALSGAVRTLALQDVQGRVAGLLRELARDEGGTHIVRPRLSQREIARRVGASPAMVNRVMKHLIAEGKITIRSPGIVVHAVPGNP